MAARGFRLLLLLLVSVSPVFCEYCYSADSKPYEFYASKTSYMEIRPGQTPTHVFRSGEVLNGVDSYDCKPLQMWHLIRHGARYPSQTDIRRFMTDLTALRDNITNSRYAQHSQMCPEDLMLLRDWKAFAVPLGKAFKLTEQGIYEQEELGADMSILLPDLLDQEYRPELYKFRYTNTERTRKSAFAYARNIFGDESDLPLPEPMDWDPMLQFYEKCAKYNEEVTNNPEATKEVNEFVQSAYVNGVVQRVRNRTAITNLEFSDIETMYSACRYFKALNHSLKSPWCAVFQKKDLIILEYWQDLKYYYTSGYGNAINYEQACLPVQDLVRTFRKRVEEGEGPLGVFYFTHTQAVLKVMSRLGLFRDHNVLRHDRISKHRKWKTSKIGPFSSNVLLVLMKCPGVDNYRVAAAVNERIAQLPGCGRTTCSWKNFLETVGRYESCQFDAICENHPPVINDGSTSSRSLGVVILSIVQTFFRFFRL